MEVRGTLHVYIFYSDGLVHTPGLLLLFVLSAVIACRRVDPRTADVQYRYIIRLHVCAYIMRRVMQRVARYIILPSLSPSSETAAHGPRDHAQVYRNVVNRYIIILCRYIILLGHQVRYSCIIIIRRRRNGFFFF